MATNLGYATISISPNGNLLQGSWVSMLHWSRYDFPDDLVKKFERYEELAAKWDAYAVLMNEEKAYELPCVTMGTEYLQSAVPDLIRGLEERMDRVGL